MTAIEFALLATPFFAVVFATLETSMVFLGELTLDHAVERVGRQVRTGEMTRQNLSQEDFRAALCEHVDYLMKCEELKIDLQIYADFASIPTNPPIKDGDIDTTGFGYSLPGVVTISALRVYYKMPLHTDVMRRTFSQMTDGSFLLVGMAAFRTEP